MLEIPRKFIDVLVYSDDSIIPSFEAECTQFYRNNIDIYWIHNNFFTLWAHSTNDVIEKQSKLIFSSMFRSSMLNEKGQTIQELAPLGATIESTDPEVLHKYMVKHASECRNLTTPIALNYAFAFLEIR